MRAPVFDRWLPVRALTLGLAATGLLAAGQLLAQTPTPRASAPVSVELLDATLWMQHAAERRALALQTYRLAGDRLRQALADPGWTAAQEQRPGFEQLPPAVILDVDETVLDNHWYEARLVASQQSYERSSWSRWCAESAATPVPGALGFCRQAAQSGVAVFYLTNRRAEQAEATRANLALHGFPFSTDRSHLLTRQDSSDKRARRQQVASEYRVLLLVGDSGGDFTSELAGGSDEQRRLIVDRQAQRWGRSWIVLPNPMYGDWMEALLEGDRSGGPDAVRGRLLARLTTHPGPGDGESPDTSAALTSRPGNRQPAAVVVASLDRAQPDGEARVPASRAAGPARHPLLRSGPMAAWSSTTAACLWLQTTRPTEVQLRHWPEGHPERARLTSVMATTRAGDLLATPLLEGLTPGTTERYELFLDGQRVATPWPLRITTQPVWEWRGPSAERPHAPPSVCLLVGSCNYVNDPPYDRPGRPYGSDERIFEAMADERPDLVLWLGDNTYMRAQDWTSGSSMRARYAHTRALPQLQRLLSMGNQIAIWDDHDYGPNDSDRSFPLKASSLSVFTDYWPDRVFGLPEAPGCFRRVSWADLDLFLLDDRSFRSPEDTPAGPGQGMLGPRQLAWLEEGLLSSSARFKLVVNGGQMLNTVTDYETWARFPAERAELLEFVTRERIEGLFFLSGDRHATELLHHARPGLPDLYELTCSPLTAGPQDRDLDGPHAARVQGTWVNQHNYARIDVTGPWGARRLTVSVRDPDGQTLWDWTLP